MECHLQSCGICLGGRLLPTPALVMCHELQLPLYPKLVLVQQLDLVLRELRVLAALLLIWEQGQLAISQGNLVLVVLGKFRRHLSN